MKRTFLSEKELVSGCIRRENDALEELYARYSARLYTLCFRYLGNTEEARDMMHDSMIKAMDCIGSFRQENEGALYVWLRRITINLVFDRLRKNSWLREIPIEQLGEEELECVVESDNEQEKVIPDSVLQQIIVTLSPVRRMVFNMYYIDGFSHKEIAVKLNITERGSTSILAKARASVRKAIADYMKTTGE